jgi:hypothetical protein
VSELATIGRAEAVTEPTLEELTATVLREHGACAAAARKTVDHAIRAGDALLQVRALLIQSEGWTLWLRENFPANRSTAYLYMRLSTYQHLVCNADGVIGADRLLKALPSIDGGSGRPRIDDARKADAERLRASGKGYKAVAAEIGASPSTVYGWFNGGTKTARERAAREALRQKERDAKVRSVVKKKGGAIAEAYAMAERLNDVIGQAHRDAENPETRRELTAAHELQRGMRDRIVRALGVES